jgi:hypothetical protein
VTLTDDFHVLVEFFAEIFHAKHPAISAKQFVNAGYGGNHMTLGGRSGAGLLGALESYEGGRHGIVDYAMRKILKEMRAAVRAPDQLHEQTRAKHDPLEDYLISVDCEYPALAPFAGKSWKGL